MSKKKAVSTMSLKDFHGGSIPSDLPLPSAPGVMVRPGLDRNTTANWGNNLIRSDLRPRPKSSGAALGGFDEKASFLSHPAPIGRNFDEDERKPLDGLSAPRRTISDESIHSTVPVQEMKPDYVSAVRIPERPISSPAPSLGSGLSPTRSGVGTSLSVNAQNLSANHNQVASGSRIPSGGNVQGMCGNPPNAWGVRKEAMGSGDVGGSSVSSGPNAASRFAQASALEKVSSGMWQSKSPGQLLPHLVYSKDNSAVHKGAVGGERDSYGSLHVSQAETGGRVARDGNLAGRDFPSYGRGHPQIYTEETQAGFSGVESQLPPSIPSEVSERPKLKLLPRSKPLDVSENDYGQGYGQAIEGGQIERAHDLHANVNASKAGPTDAKVGSQPEDRPVERPKLNLKPRSQPFEQSNGAPEIERNSLFGGARPRELVLKERGIDDSAINNIEQSHSPDRIISPRREVASEHLVSTTRQSEKTENRAANRRVGRDTDRKDQRMDHEKADVERRNRWNDKWRSGRDVKDERPEPETWRKAPTEEVKPTSPDASGIAHGKLVSALELAQAFSKSASVSKTSDVYSLQRTLPGRNNQVPFSRLTDTHELPSASTTRHRINGY